MTPPAPTTPAAPDLDDVRRRLIADRDRLLHRHGPEIDLAVCGDSADQAEVGVEAAFEDAATAGELDLLAQVERAIARIDDGSYGTCEGCGAAIDPERLEAAPRATTCLGCTGLR